VEVIGNVPRLILHVLITSYCSSQPNGSPSSIGFSVSTTRRYVSLYNARAEVDHYPSSYSWSSVATYLNCDLCYHRPPLERFFRIVSPATSARSFSRLSRSLPANLNLQEINAWEAESIFDDVACISCQPGPCRRDLCRRMARHMDVILQLKSRPLNQL
jgi:hypothetical protein